MLKLVIDTNVLIDGSEDTYRYANRILDLVLSGNVQAYANQSTLRENKLLVHNKITDQAYLQKLEDFFASIKPVQTLSPLKIVEEDSEDDKILESAIAAQADYLISSDRHLLNLGNFRGVRIVRPAEFWSRWEDEGESGWMKWMKNFIG